MTSENINQVVEVKTINGETFIQGYGVRFTDKKSPDLDGEYFTAKTNFVIAPGEKKSVPLMFDHGQDKFAKSEIFGDVEYKRDEVGIYAVASLEIKTPELFSKEVLKRRELYKKEIIKLAKKGALAWSSGAIPQSVTRAKSDTDGTTEITQWAIGEFSLTPTPAEPNNTVEYKSFKYITGEDTMNTEEIKEIVDSLESVKVIAAEITKKTERAEIKSISADIKALTETVNTLAADITELKNFVTEEKIEAEPVETLDDADSKSILEDLPDEISLDEYLTKK